MILQSPHLLYNGCGRDMQLFGSSTEALVPRDDLEGAQ
jgi:hypothetical protein